MNEENAIAKMRKLMISVETLKRFYSIKTKVPQLVMASLLFFLSSSLISCAIKVYDFMAGNPYLGYFPIGGNQSLNQNMVFVILGFAASITIYLILRRAYDIQVQRDWEDYLHQGAVGMIKIMSEYDWETTLRQLRGAKQGFYVVAVLQLLFNFVLISVILFLTMGFALYYLTGIMINGYYVLGISALITLVIGDGTLRMLYDRVWSADILIGELRRFYIDFSQREI